jgi:hypothetical protein
MLRIFLFTLFAGGCLIALIDAYRKGNIKRSVLFSFAMGFVICTLLRLIIDYFFKMPE